MSDQEAFLTRWSRRKRAAAEAAPESGAPPPESGGESAAPAPPQASASSTAAPAETPAAAEPDLDALPSIESITAETDIRAFLASGVPAQLTRAALRRAWAADPAIRDFVGLAENAWDFTAPDGVPGFGPLLPGDDAHRLVAEVLRPADQAQAIPSATPDESVQKSEPSRERAAADLESAQLSTPADSETSEGDDSVAAVQNKAAVEGRPIKVTRSHGGALPR
jgi:Protein of unknown function (DUF3306)